MKVISYNPELKGLQDQLKLAVENEDIELMEKLTNKIEKIRFPRRFHKVTYSDDAVLLDEKTGLYWNDLGWQDFHDAEDISRLENRIWRYPTIKEATELTSGCKGKSRASWLGQQGFYRIETCYYTVHETLVASKAREMNMPMFNIHDRIEKPFTMGFGAPVLLVNK